MKPVFGTKLQLITTATVFAFAAAALAQPTAAVSEDKAQMKSDKAALQRDEKQMKTDTKTMKDDKASGKMAMGGPEQPVNEGFARVEIFACSGRANSKSHAVILLRNIFNAQ